MKLYKWPEIENTYNTKHEAFKKASQLHNTIWVVTEKIDGTNIGLNIFKDSFIFNSRNQVRNPQDSFYNLYANIHLIQPIVDRLQKLFFKSDSIERVIVYGEYFGKKIMGRIDYKINYAFRFFSLQIVFTDTEFWHQRRIKSLLLCIRQSQLRINRLQFGPLSRLLLYHSSRQNRLHCP